MPLLILDHICTCCHKTCLPKPHDLINLPDGTLLRLKPTPPLRIFIVSASTRKRWFRSASKARVSANRRSLFPVIGSARRKQPPIISAKQLRSVYLPTLVSEPQQERHMKDPTDLPRTSTNPNLFGWTFGTLVVVLTIVAIITLFYALNRGPIARTGTAPATTQSAPSST
jgi:hypothetical protein